MKLHILLVDDELERLQLFTELLEATGNCRITKAGTLAQARRILECPPKVEAIDVVLIDRRLSDSTSSGSHCQGDKLLAEIVSRYPLICPIMLTAYTATSIGSAEHETLKGAFAYLRKGTKPPDVMKACQRGFLTYRIRNSRRKFEAAKTHSEVLVALQSVLDTSICSLRFALVEKFSDGAMLLRGCSAEQWQGTCLLESTSPVNDFFGETSRLVKANIAGFPTLISCDGVSLFSDCSSTTSDVVICPITPPVWSTVSGTRPPASLCVYTVGDVYHFEHPDRVTLDLLASYLSEAFFRIEDGRSASIRTSGEGARFVVNTAEAVWTLVAGGHVRLQSVLADQGELGDSAELCLSHSQSQTLRAAERMLSNAMLYITFLRVDDQAFGNAEESTAVDIVSAVEITVSRFNERLAGPSSVEGEVLPVRLDVGPSLKSRVLRVSVDERFISTAVNELLQNSLEAIERKLKQFGFTGEIIVRLSSDNAGTAVLLSVTDNGIGISEENTLRLFDRGFTTKSVTLESLRSLGLHRLRNLAVAYKGSLDGGPAVKGGCEFSLILPAFRMSAAGGATS